MKIKSLKKEKVFIPKFNNNLDLPENEQVKIWFKKFLTNSEAAEIRNYSVSSDGSISINYRDNLFLLRNISRIENLSDDDGAISDGEALSKSENLYLQELISEIRDYLLDTGSGLSEGEN